MNKQYNMYKINTRIQKEIYKKIEVDNLLSSPYISRTYIIRFYILKATVRLDQVLENIYKKFEEFDKNNKKDKIISFRYNNFFKYYINEGIKKFNISRSKYVRFCLWYTVIYDENNI